MKLVWYAHRYANAIIESDQYLKEKYYGFVDVLEGISDDDLIRDFNRRKEIYWHRCT